VWGLKSRVSEKFNKEMENIHRHAWKKYNLWAKKQII
jgi:hypothetical protein